jgi:hypothetical protein
MRLVPANDKEWDSVRQVRAAAVLEGQTITTFVAQQLRPAVDTTGEEVI